MDFKIIPSSSVNATLALFGCQSDRAVLNFLDYFQEKYGGYPNFYNGQERLFQIRELVGSRELVEQATMFSSIYIHLYTKTNLRYEHLRDIWCIENCIDRFFIVLDHWYYFASKDDAMRFRLVWG